MAEGSVRINHHNHIFHIHRSGSCFVFIFCSFFCLFESFGSLFVCARCRVGLCRALGASSVSTVNLPVPVLVAVGSRGRKRENVALGQQVSLDGSSADIL